MNHDTPIRPFAAPRFVDRKTGEESESTRLTVCRRRYAMGRAKTVTWVTAILAALTGVEHAYALRMTKMPEELQTKTTTPRDRSISLKLPLRQPVFHWKFLSKKDCLAGKLLLRITRAGRSTTITIFEDGKFSKGWEPMPLPDLGADQLYFGFLSSKKYPTAPGDRIEIEFHVKKDLEGMGPTQTGILPAGIYKAKGSYSGLLDEYALPDEGKGLPDETVATLRKMYEFRALLENWRSQWILKITGNDGWLTPEQRRRQEELLKAMEAADAEKK